MIETIYPDIRTIIAGSIEVVDDNDAPVMVMPVGDVHAQSLPHRVVLTLLYDADNRIYLQKRAKNKRLYPDRWDLSSTGHVLAGESREHAALRELREELGVLPGAVYMRASLPASAETGHAWVTLFSARLAGERPHPNPQEVSEGMFVDREELYAMVENFRELLTPAVVWAVESGLVYSEDENERLLQQL